MNGVYSHFALLLASVVFLISFIYKVINIDSVNYSYYLRDMLIFILIYKIAKYFFKYIEEIFNNYRKTL